jgi:hypothetical protein
MSCYYPTPAARSRQSLKSKESKIFGSGFGLFDIACFHATHLFGKTAAFAASLRWNTLRGY